MKERSWSFRVQLANEEESEGKNITIPYGEWKWKDQINQRFDKEHAAEIADALNKDVENGGPGIPIYQGHPDVENLAHKYPDKGALGWVKHMEATDEGLVCEIEWDRLPGKGFAYFSPYWEGNAVKTESGKCMVVDNIMSIGLVNRPNIKDFRLPNEEQPGGENNKGDNMKTFKDICAALGLPEDANEGQVWDAICKMKRQSELIDAVKAALKEMNGGNDVADEEVANECKKIADECKKKCNEATAVADECKKKCENSEQEIANLKMQLANEQAEVSKLKELKTKSETMQLPNEQQGSDAGASERLALVNEIQVAQKVDFDRAWCLAAKQKPELFK